MHPPSRYSPHVSSAIEHSLHNIPLSISYQRTRDQVEDNSDDEMSLVSRSPSPAPPADAMYVDKYEYVRRPEREVITVDTRINSSNKGFAMLAKLGWVEGQPLGLSGEGA